MPVLLEPYVLRDRGRLTTLMREQDQSFRTLAVPGKLGKTTIHKLTTGQQKTISYPKAELIANRLGVKVADLFRPQYVEGE